MEALVQAVGDAAFDEGGCDSRGPDGHGDGGEVGAGLGVGDGGEDGALPACERPAGHRVAYGVVEEGGVVGDFGCVGALARDGDDGGFVVGVVDCEVEDGVEPLVFYYGTSTVRGVGDADAGTIESFERECGDEAEGIASSS